MTSRAGAIVALLLALTLAGCGSSQPSSAVEDDTGAPSASGAVASTAPPASPEASSPESSKPPASQGTAKGPPPKPGNTTFKKIGEKPGPKKGLFTETYKITWTSPKGVADSFLVYGLPFCPRESKKNQGTPCVVRGMKIPADKLVLLGTAPGDKRQINVSWDVNEADVAPYSAVLMRAANEDGNSIFTIVHSDDVCYGCTY